MIPKSKWRDLIKMQEDNQSSPLHIHKQAKVPILNQKRTNYCWIHGVAAGMMNRMAHSGIRPVPHLSPCGTGARGKNFRNVGGWGGEAIEYNEKYGMPTTETWPEGVIDPDLVTHEMELDSKPNHIAEFEELPSEQIIALGSALLDPTGAKPVTGGLMWWGHLICFLRVRWEDGQFVFDFVNSWDETWAMKVTAR